jgi:hypothetical protein
MSSNYPAGVSDSHPYFNPPAISANAVECGADEARILPEFLVRVQVMELAHFVQHRIHVSDSDQEVKSLEAVNERVQKMLIDWAPLAQEREYECPFNDEIDLEESECARWNCPVCGNERETDTMPEERDPDYEWDHRGEGR